jgi:hypothetical protein
MRSILAITALSAMSVMAQVPLAPARAPVPPPKGPLPVAVPAPGPLPPKGSAPLPVAVPLPAPLPPKAIPVPKGAVPPPPIPGPKGALPPPPKTPPAWEGVRQPGPGVLPPKGVQLPDLSSTASRFPPGPEVNSTKLIIQGKPGAYSVAISEIAAFPGRTVYLPQNVPPSVKVPIFAWENGMCYLYGRMYQAFLQEVASHGYLVIAPGARDKLDQGRSTADWQLDTISQARGWANAPFSIDRTKVAVGGHSCGGGETFRNLARVDPSEVTTGLIFNSASPPEVLDDISVPMLWVHGGQTDTEDRISANLDYVSKSRPELPVALVGLQTGHLGSFWWPRGGIYAETAVKWLNGQLKNVTEDKNFFYGEKKSGAAKRGWAVDSNNLGE